MRQSVYLTVLSLMSTLTQAAGVVGTGDAASCTETALQTALTGGGDVSFNCGTATTIPITSEKLLETDTTIDGGYLVTLDGQNKNRIFITKKNVKLTVKNLSIINGFTTDQGGGIKTDIFNTLTIDNVTFQNNEATRDTKPCDGGGAIFVGAGSKATITHSRFIGNRANNGGAINNLRSDLLITDSEFTRNEAIHSEAIDKLSGCGGGGAVYIDGANKVSNGGGGPGSLKLLRNTFTANKTNDTGGAIYGYIYFKDTLEIEDSVFDGNQAVSNKAPKTKTGKAGAIWYGRKGSGDEKATDKMYLRNSLIMNNHADNSGGGVIAGAVAEMVNCTFIGNDATNPDINDPKEAASGYGGAIIADNVTEIINCTIVNNHAGFVAGGIRGANKGDPQPILKNTIIANNTAAGFWEFQQNCNTYLENGGGNIQFPDGKDHVCFENVTAVDPMLATELADNGGPTLTLALLSNSPAIDTADAAHCPATDQRGSPRPVDGNHDGTAQCDSGAFEFGASTAVTTHNGGGIDSHTGQAVSTSAHFVPQITLPSGKGSNGARVGQEDTVTLAMTIQVDPAHLQQTATIVLAASYTPAATTTPLWFQRAADSWQAWEGSLTSLLAAPADTRTSLSDNETVAIFEGVFGKFPGQYTVYTGYAIDSGVIIFNQGEPLTIIVE